MPSSIPLLSALIIVPVLGMVFTLIAKDNEDYNNSASVALFVVLFDVFLIIKAFNMIDIDNEAPQLMESFNWLSYPLIDISFGVNAVSLIIMLAVHVAIVIGLAGVWNNKSNQKAAMVWTCMFLGMMNGFLAAADIFSFYIFFEALRLPVVMLVGMFGNIKKNRNIFRLLIYNLTGGLFLFAAIVVIENSAPFEVMLKDVGRVINSDHKFELFVWICVFIAFISRMPIWPFHHWISAVNSNIKNPLVFIIANMIPLSAVYGFMQFLPPSMPTSMSYYITALMFISLISMIFIALIGLVNKEITYKVFSYMTVYYILYLMAALLGDDLTTLNIAFSLFAFLIISAAIIVIFQHIEQETEENNLHYGGILCATPRIYFILSFLTLAAVGLPVSALFLNNFIIAAKIIAYDIWFGAAAVLSMLLVSITFIRELYRMHDTTKIDEGAACMMDMQKRFFSFMIIVMIVLFASFLNPLWFVGIGG